MLAKQIDFGSKLYSPMEKLLALDQIRYHKPVKIVKQFFDFYMQLRIQEEIRIIPNYPTGWFAEVVSEDKVWTLECDRGELKLLKVGDLIGFTRNGSYIVANEEDILEYEYCYQCYNFEGSKSGIAYCRDLCDDGDYSEFRCRCCPWVIND